MTKKEEDGSTLILNCILMGKEVVVCCNLRIRCSKCKKTILICCQSE